MTFARLAKQLAAHRRAAGFVALISTFAGVALIIDRPKGSILEWLAIPLLLGGGGTLAWMTWPASNGAGKAPSGLASQFLRIITWHGRLVKLFPVIGAGIILADLEYNAFVSATPALQTEDIIVLLAAVVLIGYAFVPARFARGRDFVLTFFIVLNGILVVPLLLARAYYSDFEQSVDLYSWVALAPETSAVLNLLGVSNTVHSVTGATAPGLTFTPRNLPAPVTLVITTACSGIYSFGIFASAFVAFVLTEQEKLSPRVWVFLGLGLLGAYMANVLRMTVIVLVGYYTDTAQTDLQNMLLAHSYLGWIIFLAWTSLFWWALVRFLPTRAPNTSESTPAPLSRGAICAVCNRSLSPVVPAVRCACGSYSHRACMMDSTRCPSCGRLGMLASSA